MEEVNKHAAPNIIKLLIGKFFIFFFLLNNIFVLRK